MTTLLRRFARSDGDAPALASLPALAWRDVVRWALLGTLVVLALVIVDVGRNGGNNPVSLIQPGTRGPSYALIHRDFPDVVAPDGLGLDGQMYYAMARDPLHPDQVATSLDRPRYRLQRPLLPWLAWLVHPSGGGSGLIFALFVTGLASVFLGAVATGALAVTLGGRPWLGALLPILPGTYWSLRVTVSDAPALALAMVALALSARRRPVLAVLVGVLAVLAKEPMVLLFLGWGLWRRDRQGAALVAVPALVAVAWMAWLRVVLPGSEAAVSEIDLVPFGGLLDAATTRWADGQELVGMVSSVGAIVAGAVALALRRRHPLWWTVAGLMALAAFMNGNVIGMNFGGTRSNQALLLLAAVALLTPAAIGLRPGATPRAAADAAEPASAGRVLSPSAS